MEMLQIVLCFTIYEICLLLIAITKTDIYFCPKIILDHDAVILLPISFFTDACQSY